MHGKQELLLDLVARVVPVYPELLLVDWVQKVPARGAGHVVELAQRPPEPEREPQPLLEPDVARPAPRVSPPDLGYLADPCGQVDHVQRRFLVELGDHVDHREALGNAPCTLRPGIGQDLGALTGTQGPEVQLVRGDPAYLVPRLSDVIIVRGEVYEVVVQDKCFGDRVVTSVVWWRFFWSACIRISC
ncbi:hypothetical protein PG984_007556 [Apiospora sp. TS-2023a]